MMPLLADDLGSNATVSSLPAYLENSPSANPSLAVPLDIPPDVLDETLKPKSEKRSKFEVNAAQRRWAETYPQTRLL